MVHEVQVEPVPLRNSSQSHDADEETPGQMLPSKEGQTELAPHQHCGYSSLQHLSSGFIFKDVVHISDHIALMTV
jgi:hypothetical protein